MHVRSLYDLFPSLPDHRSPSGKRFNQAGVLTLVVLALLSQQNSLRQIAAWVAVQDVALSTRLGFRFGRLPSYGTIRRVLLGLDLPALRAALAAWLHDLTRTLPLTHPSALPLTGVAIDGKSVRGSADPATELPALRLLSAVVHDLGATLAQQPIASSTNELGSLPTLLQDLVLADTLVTLDAHFTTREVATTIREKRGTICFV
jgi:hypothetical protein